jgi:protein-S-isoprenylcysteine O-methyltransferase Ste14
MEFVSMSQSTQSTPPSITRRTAFVGAGVGAAGAIAAATLLPAVVKAPEPSVQAKAETSGGYQLTEHVKQYYATARI